MSKKFSESLRMIDQIDSPSDKVKIPILADGIMSEDPELRGQVIQQLTEIALRYVNYGSSTSEIFLSPLIAILKSGGPEQSQAASEALSKIIVNHPLFKDSLMKSGFIEMARFTLMDSNTPDHVLSSILRIILDLTFINAEVDCMSSLIPVLKKLSEEKDLRKQDITIKAKKISAILASQGVSKPIQPAELLELKRLNDQLKKENEELKRNNQEKVRKIAEYLKKEQEKKWENTESIRIFEEQKTKEEQEQRISVELEKKEEEKKRINEQKIRENEQKMRENEELKRKEQIKLREIEELRRKDEEAQKKIQELERKDWEKTSQMIETDKQLEIFKSTKTVDLPISIIVQAGSFTKKVNQFTYTATANQNMTFTISPTIMHGVSRCEFKINKMTLPFFGVIRSGLSIPFGKVPSDNPYKKDNVIFFFSGLVYQNGKEISGNQFMKDDDIIAIEVNMTIPRTAHLFINSIQQPVFMSGLPESVQFYFFLNSQGDSATVLSLKKLAAPTIANIPDAKEVKWE